MKKEIVLGSLMLLAFAVGRFSAPEKVKIVKEEVRVEVTAKTQTSETEHDLKKEQDREVIVTERISNDGSKTVRTRIINRTKEETKAKDRAVSTEEKSTVAVMSESKEVTSSSRKISVHALTGVSLPLTLPRLHYGLHAERPFLGPVSLGIWGLSSGQIGLSLGLTF